ncbi:MAG: hypothetical protein KBD64_07495 [Gammaproteobacteria bacterium]|nr:hypothetical protein [Gammaproteobacteria bacterium]
MVNNLAPMGINYFLKTTPGIFANPLLKLEKSFGYSFVTLSQALDSDFSTLLTQVF